MAKAATTDGRPPWCSCRLEGTNTGVLEESTKNFSSPEELFAALSGQVSVPARLQQNLPRIAHAISSPLNDLQRYVIVSGLGQRDLLCLAPAGFGQGAAALLSMLAVTNRNRTPSDSSQPRKPICPDTLVLCATAADCDAVRDLGEQLVDGTELNCLRLDARGHAMQATGGLVLVATPQELSKRLSEKKEDVDLSSCFGLVLDGVSTMLDMGLKSELVRLVLHSGLPKADHRITMMFGTDSPRLQDLARSFLFMPLVSSVSVSGNVTIWATDCGRSIDHTWEVVKWEDKLWKLHRAVKDFQRQTRWREHIVVFAHSVMHVKAIVESVDGDSFAVKVHGDPRRQPEVLEEHEQSWSRFCKTEILVAACTELGTKLKDISFATCIVNFDLPLNERRFLQRFGEGNSRLGPKVKILTYVSEENFMDEWADGRKEALEQIAAAFDSPIPEEIQRLASESRGNDGWQRDQAASSWDQPASGWQQAASSWDQPASGWQQAASSWDQPASGWQQDNSQRDWGYRDNGRQSDWDGVNGGDWLRLQKGNWEDNSQRDWGYRDNGRQSDWDSFNGGDWLRLQKGNWEDSGDSGWNNGRQAVWEPCSGYQ